MDPMTASLVMEKAYATGRAMHEDVKAKALSENDIKRDMADQLVRKDPEVVPFGQVFGEQSWMFYKAIDRVFQRQRHLGGFISKADSPFTTTGGVQPPTIRTDIVPHLYPTFVKNFPYIEGVSCIQANGLSHTWDLITDPENAGSGKADFVDDLVGQTQATAPTITQLSTLVAIALGQTGATMRMQLAQAASGMSYDGKDASQIAIENELIAVSKLEQTQVFSGCKSDSGGTSSNESGAYNAVGYDGYRGIIGHPNSHFDQYYPAGTTNLAFNLGTQTFVEAINQVGQGISDVGGDLGDYEAWMSYGAYTKIAAEAGQLLRMAPGSGAIAYGTNVQSLIMGQAEVPIRVVPGPFIGQYTYSGVTTISDINFLNRKETQMACLGPMAPFVIQIPVGALDGTLTFRYLVAWLASLVVNTPSRQAKLRVDLAA